MNSNLNSCLICGDRANGFNFNVLSCDSCKAFFRRNAYKQEEFRCALQGKCQMDKKNRKLCRFCRLEKCFKNGMKKEWILNEEQRKVRKIPKGVGKKNIKPKIKNSNNLSEDNKSKELMNEEIGKQMSDKTNYRYICNELSGQLSLCVKYSKNGGQIVPEFQLFPIDGRHNQIEPKVYSSEQESNHCNQEFNELQKVSIFRPITDYRNNLSELEGNYLTELLSATNILKIPLGSVISEATTLMDAVHAITNATVIDSLRYVSMFKSLKAFTNICPSDRLTVMRSGLIQLFTIRSVMGFFQNDDREYLIVASDSTKSSTCLIDLDVFKRAKPHFYSVKRALYRKISHEWDSDEIILDLMTAIILFNAEKRPIIEPQTVRRQQQIYKYLLQRYLLLKYRSEMAAKDKYCRLIKIIDYLQLFFREATKMVTEENFVVTKICVNLFDKIDL